MLSILLLLTHMAESASAGPCADADFIDSSYDSAIRLYVDGRTEEALRAFQALKRCVPENKPVISAVRRLADEIRRGNLRSANGKEPARGGTALVSKGKKLYQVFNCRYCHSLKGGGGASGPKLDEVGGRLSLTEIEKHLLNPREDRAAVRMPNLRLQPSEVNALAAYLVSTRSGP